MASPAEPESVVILGSRIDRVNHSTALARMIAFCRENRPHLIVTADSSMLVRARSDPALREIMDSADLVVPDSIGVVWASRLLGDRVEERVAGVELAEEFCHACADNGWTVFLLGAAPGVALRAAEQLKARYPRLQVVGTQHGYFSPAEEPAVLAEIRRCAPTALLVAMGIPRQEKWLARHLPDLAARLGIGVGGTLDVLSGEVRRAPGIFQRTNMEWLYRVLTEPKRIRKTVLLPRFVLLVLREKLLRLRRPERVS